MECAAMFGSTKDSKNLPNDERGSESYLNAEKRFQNLSKEDQKRHKDRLKQLRKKSNYA